MAVFRVNLASASRADVVPWLRLGRELTPKLRLSLQRTLRKECCLHLSACSIESLKFSRSLFWYPLAAAYFSGHCFGRARLPSSIQVGSLRRSFVLLRPPQQKPTLLATG